MPAVNVNVEKSSQMLEPATEPIIDNHQHEVGLNSGSEFDASKDLAFSPPSKIVMMEDIGYGKDTGVSPVAVSEPFPLFSQAAVERMREEVLSEDVWNSCRYSSDLAACQLRGFAPLHAKFVYDAWHHPETLAIISKVAGVELVPEMDFEIAHVNISVKTAEQTIEELAAYKAKTTTPADEAIHDCSPEDEKPVVDWHNDSYPFVCVLMLSDCSTMIGGETALKTASGEIRKVRGPEKGCAVVLQGRYIEHQALPAFGATERITMVTSFRPRSAALRDDTVLTTVRPISDLSELYNQFSEYRLEIVESRIRKQLKKLRMRKGAGKKFDTGDLKTFLDEQEDFLAHTNREIVEEEKVVVGQLKLDAKFAGVGAAEHEQLENA
ncbi:MAG: hypothetical protein M1812_000443 [Candelaria pacifica]|nr:MAG: hypothetical protein M1812_000443 [Candelaria pacifica]